MPQSGNSTSHDRTTVRHVMNASTLPIIVGKQWKIRIINLYSRLGDNNDSFTCRHLVWHRTSIFKVTPKSHLMHQNWYRKNFTSKWPVFLICDVGRLTMDQSLPVIMSDVVLTLGSKSRTPPPPFLLGHVGLGYKYFENVDINANSGAYFDPN
jgi:hypothetical protein